MSVDTVCALCKHRPCGEHRSVCETCVPPDESEVVARTALKGERRRSAELANLLREFVDKEEPSCRLDHNGFCQAHLCGRPCLVMRARKSLRPT